MITIDVLVLLDVVGLEDRDKFEKHVKKEGFIKVEKMKILSIQETLQLQLLLQKLIF